MKENFLLKAPRAMALYTQYAKALPIIDFHNHLSVEDIKNNRRFGDITELWLESDPYKHRLMRICGVDEHYITGDASHIEKFEAFCSVFPRFVGNPVYDWARMELSSIFGIEELPSKQNARYLYDKCGEMLRSPEFSNNAILSSFHIEYQSPVATLTQDLSAFASADASLAPSLRGDELLSPTAELIQRLAQITGRAVTDTATYLDAVSVLLDAYDAAGCSFADHALDSDFFASDTDGKRRDILKRLAAQYAERGWTMLLHIGAKRQTSARLLRLAGPAGGYAATGEGFSLSALCDLLGDMERGDGLPDTVLFPLNMGDQAPMAVMQGSFAEDGTPSKVQLGPAWWWCDHALGIRNTLASIASFGVLSEFIGMTTDSRSILSFVRHDYFRRLLCSWLDEQAALGDWEVSDEDMGEIITKICYQNAKSKIRRKKGHERISK